MERADFYKGGCWVGRMGLGGEEWHVQRRVLGRKDGTSWRGMDTSAAQDRKKILKEPKEEAEEGFPTEVAG